MGSLSFVFKNSCLVAANYICCRIDWSRFLVEILKEFDRKCECENESKSKSLNLAKLAKRRMHNGIRRFKKLKTQ